MASDVRPPVRRRRRVPAGLGGRGGFGIVTLCVIGGGLLVNVFLVLAARALTPSAYAHFGAFWSLSLVVGIGVFLPVEQELARLLHTGASGTSALGSVARVAAVLALGELVVLGVLAVPVLSPALGHDPALVAAAGCLAVVSAVQYTVRGGFIGLGRLDVHGAVILLDAGLRVGFAVVVVTALHGADPAWFGWALVAAIGVAHTAAVPWVRRRVDRRDAGRAASGDPVPTRPLLRGAGHLLVGALLAQLLLNFLPILLPAVTPPSDGAQAGRFVAAFTLARVPLFIAVPVQSAVLPAMTRLVAAGRHLDLVALVRRIVLGLVAAAVVGGAVAWVAGPFVVGLLFGSGYVLPGVDLAALTAGTFAYLGTVLVTQALVAAERQRAVALAWVAGAVVAAAAFAALDATVARATVAYAAGSCAALVVAVAALLGRRARAGPTVPTVPSSPSSP